MAVVSLKTGYWDNGDGLRVAFPQTAGTVTRGGEVDFDGRHMTKAVIALASLPTQASGNKQIILENCVFPAGAFIEQVEVFVTKEPTDASGTANLDLGFVKTDRSTELDFNGLLAAADAFNAGTDLGAVVLYDTSTTESGALVGTVLAFDGILTANPETADFTGGVIEVRIYWSIPLAADI